MNLILSFAKGYSQQQLEPFFKSLIKSKYSDQLTFVTDSSETLYDNIELPFRYEALDLGKLNKTGFNDNSIIWKLIYKYLLKRVTIRKYSLHILLFLKESFDINWFYIIYGKICHVYLLRFLLFHKVIIKSKAKNIFITDCRDVIFLKDPFKNIKEGGIYFFSENNDLKIKDEPYNSMWVKNLYGAEIYEKLKNQSIYNIGTVLGTNKSMSAMLRKILVESFDKNISSVQECQDQGILNYLIGNNVFPESKNMMNGQHVFTVGVLSKNNLAFKNECLYYNNELIDPAVIHQYDRIPILNSFYNRLLNISSSLEDEIS
jgi:hypothetical protein